MDPFVDFSRLRVLVIDDEKYARETASALLLRLGVERVWSATEGHGGLATAAAVKPNLVLCDIHMQPMNGLEFVAALRAHENKFLSRIPVILLTADSNKGTIDAGRAAGADSYLVKPVALNGLKGRIGSVLSGRAPI